MPRKPHGNYEPPDRGVINPCANAGIQHLRKPTAKEIARKEENKKLLIWAKWWGLTIVLGVISYYSLIGYLDALPHLSVAMALLATIALVILLLLTISCLTIALEKE